jgi:sigma-B regulation protein RsbU (phosphoserine phosphatase)
MISRNTAEKELTILVIDNDAVVRGSITAALTKIHCRVVLADNPTQGIERFHSACPDLVIINIHLPEASSFSTLQQLFELAPDLPIIVMADRGNTDDLLGALRLGVSDYLTLPLADGAILEHAIDNSLKRARLIEENSRIRKKLELINAEMEQRIEIFKQDQQAGRHVQINMLPQPPQVIGGFKFNHRVLPSLYLSGDTVDYKPVSSHQTLFYIADVSGHGSSSAFITILLRFRIEQMRREHIRSRFSSVFTPASILTSLNNDLLDSGLDKHITLFMGLLDDTTGTLVYSVAGHHPLPFLYEHGKAALIPLEKSSFPVGLFAGATYFDTTTQLSEDFALVLFSDGILEFLKLPDMTAKENYICRIMEESQGDFDRMKAQLGLNKHVSVPDDIAVMSVTRA